MPGVSDDAAVVFQNVRTPFSNPCPQAMFLIGGVLSPPMRATGPLFWAGIHATLKLTGLRSDRHRVGDLFALLLCRPR